MSHASTLVVLTTVFTTPHFEFGLEISFLYTREKKGYF